MKLYRNDNINPYFNLATEQYLMDTESEDVFMLWRNDRSVIIGRNQNAYAEINHAFVEEHEMTPERCIAELRGMEKRIYRKLYAGGLSKKLYRLYEYQKENRNS